MLKKTLKWVVTDIAFLTIFTFNWGQKPTKTWQMVLSNWDLCKKENGEGDKELPAPAKKQKKRKAALKSSFNLT